MNYHAPLWLPGGNLQTIWPALCSKRFAGPQPLYRRERWDAPDGDFIDVDWLIDGEHPRTNGSNQTLLVLFHGLEGSSGSHYAQAFAAFARAHQLEFAVPHFRGCSGELNRAPRAYHSGDHEEIAWILERFRQQWMAEGSSQRNIVAVGVSLGGNALLRWAQEAGHAASTTVRAIASVCAPLDLAASGKAIGTGFNRWVYTRMFLRTMKPRALMKWNQYPGLFDRDALMQARDLYDFDNVFTAPLHGYRHTDDYWSRCSSHTRLHQIKVPALVVNAGNDPFVPKDCLPMQRDVGASVRLWQPRQGGHVGFAAGAFPGHLEALPHTVGRWLLGAS